MGLGEPLSLALGGGPSPQEEVYSAMYQNVGDGIRADPDTLVEMWRMARARGIAAFHQDDRATAQAFPDLSIDYLPVWEDILRITPEATASITERQDAVLLEYTRTIDASYPKLLSQLTDIDSTMRILLMPHIYARTTVPARGFEDWDPSDPNASGPAFDLASGRVGSTATAYPNYSDEFVLHVLFDVGAAIINASNQRKLTQARDELNESLPAWVDFQLFSACGFDLDADLLDVTAFCDGITIGP